MSRHNSSSTQVDESPLVSVIIPAYNSATHIADAIDSVLGQNYPALEIIVIDDGSTDATRDIVSRYGANVQLLSQANQGSAAARNLGIQHATGEYIAFLDADDAWWSGKIRYQVDALTQSGHKMAYSRFIRWYAHDNDGFTEAQTEFQIPDNPNLSTFRIVTGSLYAELLLDSIVWTSTVIVEKSELEKVGLFDTSLRKGQDYDLWLKLSRQIDILGLERPTALYRMHPTSITKSVKDINYEYIILSRTLAQWGENGPDGRSPPPGMIKARLARSSFLHGYAHLKYGNPRIALKSLRDSMAHSGIRFKTLVFLLVATMKNILNGMRS